MQHFSAIVKSGRLVLDEPSELPEGEVVLLLPLSELLAAAEDGDEDGDIAFAIAPPMPERTFRKAKTVDAAALIEELRNR